MKRFILGAYVFMFTFMIPIRVHAISSKVELVEPEPEPAVIIVDNPQVIHKVETPREQLQRTFHYDLRMVSVCGGESDFIPTAESKTDITADGYTFSIGLCQINLTWHKIGNLNCPDAFNGRNYKATIKNKSLYNQCVKAAKDVDLNIEAAERIYKNSGIRAWGAYTNGGYKKYL